MFGLDNLINLLFDSAVENVSRNERVIQLLKRLKLDPDHPPEDFTGVYQYALVEYGVGKPRPVLEIFRQTEIQQLFREALEQNNPSKLLQRGEAFLADSPLQADLQASNIDVRREFYAFAAVFIEVAKRTRTPAEILAEQKLESLHRQIGSLQERLNRLPTIEGLRTEMARLAAPSFPALPGSESFSAEQCKAFALAQQMRGWFETLGFDLESHEVWQDDSFEWIINIPVRRGRYDRILVRGIDGEAGLRDVEALKQSVETHRTDEGWLVTARRISRAARDEVEKAENEGLGCYTLDELLDQDADFSGYLTWLETEIQKRDIDQKYVPLACLKEEIDPDTQQRIGVSRYDDRDGWIDGYIDLWLDDPAKEHISVLGEFGTGKTWFALHYAWKALQRYREAQRRGLERPRLPLVIPLRDYAKAVSVESLFSEFFFRKHEIPIPGYSAFEQLNRMGKLLLIFDGFDEMAARVDRQEMINNFWELAKVVVPGAKVILTCRTEHFPDAKEGRALLNAELQASTRDLTGETPQFEVLELEKFNDEQIRQVLEHQAQPTTVEQIMGNPHLLDLARRPVLTELILEALPDIEAGKPVDMSRVYLYAVRHKMERDIKAERTFTSMADKLYFMCELSWEMLSTDRMSINYREFPDRIRKLFGPAVQEEKDLDHWHYDMMGQTMLIRNADGDYTPAHRSLLEFFVAYKFAAELGVLLDDFLEIIRSGTNISATSKLRDYTWSEYFCLYDENDKAVKGISLLSKFITEPVEKLLLTIGKAPLSKAVIDLMLPIIQPFENSPQYPLLGIFDSARKKEEASIGFIIGNVSTLLLKLNRNALSERDLSHLFIKGGDFVGANLRNTNLQNSILIGSVFPHSFSSIFAISYSQGGKFFATGGATCVIDIWSAKTNKLVNRLRGHENWVRSLAFSHDDKNLVSAAFDNTVKIWDIESAKCIKTLNDHTSRVNAVILSSDSRYIFSASDDQAIRQWNFNTGECVRIFQGHSDAVEAIVLCEKENLLISASLDTTIRLWNLETGKCFYELMGHTKKVRSLALDPQRVILASGSSDHTIRLWDLASKECIEILQEHADRVSTLAFNHDGKLLASGCYDSNIKLWDTQSGKELGTFLGHTDWVRMVAFTPNKNAIASVSDDQTIKLWDLETKECFQTIQGVTGEIRTLALSSDEKALAVGCEDKYIRVWKFEDPNSLFIPNSYFVLDGHQSRVNSVAIDPGSEILATASFDSSIRLWNLNSGDCIRVFSGHQGCVNSITFNQDGKYLVSTGADYTVRLWKVDNGKCIRIMEGHDNWLWAVQVSPDGSAIVSGGDDQTIRFWDFNTGECIAELKEHKGGINSIKFLPNGKSIVSGGSDRKIRLWNIENKQCYRSWEAHRGSIMSIAVSPCGHKIASSSREKEIKVWDVSTGECLQVLKGHTDGVRSVTFTLSNTELISGSFDQTVRIWDIRTGKTLRVIRPPRLYEGADITNVVGLTDLEKSVLKVLGAVEAS